MGLEAWSKRMGRAITASRATTVTKAHKRFERAQYLAELEDDDDTEEKPFKHAWNKTEADYAEEDRAKGRADG